MTVFEAARQLGELLLETEEGKQLTAKKEAFDSNKDAQEELMGYTKYREQIQAKIQSGQMTEDEFKKEQEIIDKKIADLKKNSFINDMVEAENNFGMLFNQVMSILRSTVDGVEEQGCSGDCSSGCGGCH